MSFSEHLEELRKALLKSLAALMLGALVGLFFGQEVVDYIQTPIRGSLERFYRHQAAEEHLTRLETRAAEGLPVPDDLGGTAQELAKQDLVPYDLYLDPGDLDQLLGDLGIDTNIEAEQEFRSDREELIHLRTYRPLQEDPRLHLISLSGHESFMVYIKASLVVGAMIASPAIFFFIWDFVAAGLYRHERKYIYIFLPISLGLFFSGAALAFFVVFRFVLDFLFWFNQQMGINPTPQISEWMSFVLMLPVGFGISFQLPLVMLFLERVGIFTVENYQSKWRIAVLVIAILSMLLTPADPGSMILMGVPLVALYFLGIAMCKHMPRGSKPRRQASSG